MTKRYSHSLEVQQRSLEILLPFIDQQTDGRMIVMDNGPLARAYQKQQGDVLFKTKSGRAWSAELKAEEEHTGNLFLETWSNRNLEDPRSQHERGSNPGWMLTLRSDLLFYHFLDTGHLYILPFFRLKQWAFGHGKTPGRIYYGPPTRPYVEARQGKVSQLNDTWGRLVNISDLKTEKLVQVFFPLQVEMFPDRTGRITDESQQPPASA